MILTINFFVANWTELTVLQNIFIKNFQKIPSRKNSPAVKLDPTISELLVQCLTTESF